MQYCLPSGFTRHLANQFLHRYNMSRPACGALRPSETDRRSLLYNHSVLCLRFLLISRHTIMLANWNTSFGFMIVLSIFLLPVETKVTIAIKLKTFDNKGNYAFHSSNYCGATWLGTCNLYFKICIKPSNGNPNDLSGCWYYKNTVDSNRNAKKVDFATVNTGIPKEIVISKDSWPGNIAVYMEIWDKDYSTLDDLVDKHSFRKEIAAAINGSQALKYNEVSIGRRPSNPASNLTFQLRVYCDLYYYGTNCDQYCKGQNDASAGHYICEASGERVCRGGWHNPPTCLTHCVPQDGDRNGHFTCTKNGTRVCRQGWYGEPGCNQYCAPNTSASLSQYVCSRNGTRICLNGWMGQFCNSTAVPESKAPSKSTLGSLTQRKNPESALQSFLSTQHREVFMSKSSSQTTVSTLEMVVTSSKLRVLLSRPSSQSEVPISNFVSSKSSSVTSTSFAITFPSILTPEPTSSRSIATSWISSLEMVTSKSATMMTKHFTHLRQPSTLTSHTINPSRPSLRFIASPTQTSVLQSSRKPLSSSLQFLTSNTLHSLSSFATPTSNTTERKSISDSLVQNVTLPPALNNEGDADIFVWMMETPKGNLVFIGFSLAFVFLLAFILAVIKICQMKQSAIRRVSIRKELSPDKDAEDKDANFISEGANQKFQMCSAACFGVIRKTEPQFSYQKQQTAISTL